MRHAGCARFERALPKPDPPVHLLSQSRRDAGNDGGYAPIPPAQPAGEADFADRLPSRSSTATNGSAAQTLRPRIACEPRSFRSAGPRTPSLRWPPAATTRYSRAAPANRTLITSNPLARAECDHASGTVGRSSCSRGPTTQGLGHACCGAPRRATETSDTRGAFHRSATLIQPAFALLWQ